MSKILIDEATLAQRKYRRGDRLICLETEEYCVIHISGTDRQWVKFPDAHIGVYKNEQLAELFELLPKEIGIEQPAPVAKPHEQEHVTKHYVDGGHIVYPAAQRQARSADTWVNATTWVGLTDEELEQCDAHETWRSMKNVEAKLRSKNEDRN